MKKLSILLFSFFVLSINAYNQIKKPHKIIGLVAVRNEADIVGQCLKALSLYTDAIIVLDDASDDGKTVPILESLANECNIVQIIKKTVWFRDEPGDKNKLLEAGRKAGGTHFIVIDADEIFTSNCLHKNFLRNKILSLQPGDVLHATWIQLWRSTEQYRYDSSPWSGSLNDCIFCDQPGCSYNSNFIHCSRSPNLNLTGQRYNLPLEDPLLHFRPQQVIHLNYQQRIRLTQVLHFVQEKYADLSPQAQATKAWTIYSTNQFTSVITTRYQGDYSVGLMHFQFVNWENLLIKQAWYRCLERIRNPKMNPYKINKIYGESKNEVGLETKVSPQSWFSEYKFFDKDIYAHAKSWQKIQVQVWLEQYGKSLFKKLDIWDIDWN